MGAHPSSWDVIGFGANSVDHVAVVPAMPEARGPRAKMRILSHTVSGGGQVLTAMATCARLGLHAKYVGVVGTDDNGRFIRDLMQQRGIDTADVVERDGANQFAFILVDESGERVVLWSRDDRLSAEAVDIDPGVLGTARLLHVDDVDPVSSMRAAVTARRLGLPVTSDIDRAGPEARALIEAVTIPILAEHVPVALTGERLLPAGLRALQRAHHEVLIVTLGEHGALALEGDTLHHEEGFIVEAVDTTGSGDVFRGGFIYGRLRGWPVPQLLRFANAAAAVACTRMGALAGTPALADVESMMATGQQRIPRATLG